jgi:hypothetical protein
VTVPGDRMLVKIQKWLEPHNLPKGVKPIRLHNIRIVSKNPLTEAQTELVKRVSEWVCNNTSAIRDWYKTATTASP